MTTRQRGSIRLPVPDIPRSEVIDEFMPRSSTERLRCTMENGRSRRMEVCLAMLQSAREQKEIASAHIRSAFHGSSEREQAPATDNTQAILQHWREAVPNDRLAHLVKDATRALLRALQMRLAAHSVSLGHWTFLRILWERDGLTQKELSEQAGVMEPTTFSALKAMERFGTDHAQADAGQ